MSDFNGVLDPTAAWADVPKMTVEAVLIGGDGGTLNAQAQALAARTKVLKATNNTQQDDIDLHGLQIGTLQDDIDLHGLQIGTLQDAVTDLDSRLDSAEGTLSGIALAIMQAVYPVGTPYFNKTDDRNPSAILGFGTWARESGKVLVGLDSGDTDFDTAGETGGSKTATGTVGSHTLTNSEVPAVSPSTSATAGGGTQSSPITSIATASTAASGHSHGFTGGSNLQPYVVYHWWVRTA